MYLVTDTRVGKRVVYQMLFVTESQNKVKTYLTERGTGAELVVESDP